MNHTESGFAEINGASLYYETAGTGRPFVMLHGHLLDHRQWDDQFSAFAASYHVARYDARGFGQSSLPAAPFSHADNLLKLMQFLGLQRAYLTGCSGGGGTCIDFALQHPAMADALILVASNLDGYRLSPPLPPRLLAYFQARQRGDLEQALDLSLEAFTDGPRREPGQVNPVARTRTRAMTAALLARAPVTEAEPHGLQPPALDRLAELRAPTLAITGAEDNSMLHDIAALLTAGIPGAKSVVIPDAGHHPNLEHPELFNQIVTTFLGEIERS
jgi:3-oxoadipate enol-lactonase